MSFLFGGSQRQPSSAEKMAMIEFELEFNVNMADKMMESCITKCIPKGYHEGEINKGESVCLDRCASKFLAVTQLIQKAAQDQANGGASAPSAGKTGGFFG